MGRKWERNEKNYILKKKKSICWVISNFTALNTSHANEFIMKAVQFMLPLR